MPNLRDPNLPAYSREEMDNALRKIKTGKSIRSVAKSCKIPRSTLYDHAFGKYKGHNVESVYKKTLSATDETALCNYITYMSDRGFPLTRKMISTLVVAIAKKSNRETQMNLDKGPSKKWLKRFIKKHPELTERRPDNLERARAEVTKEQIDQYFQLLGDTLERLGIRSKPSAIFNCDETGFSGKETYRGKVIVRRGTKHAYQQSVRFTGHTTVHVAASADGKIIPPLIIFEKCLPRNIIEDIPTSWSISATQNGYITTDLFHAWFRDVFLAECGVERPILLIMDNHISHLSPDIISLAQENNVELLCLPPHSTHLLQPLDKGYFNLLKSQMAEISVALGYAGTRLVPREKFPKILQFAMSKISGSKVAASFQGTGIYPYNPKAVNNPIKSQPVQSTSPEKPSEDNLCSHCGADKENILVKLGLIPASLQDILVDPPKPKENSRKRKKIEGARVITNTKIIIEGSCIPSRKVIKEGSEKSEKTKNNFTESKKRVGGKKKEKMGQKKSDFSIVVESDEEACYTDSLCEVCMLGYRKGYTWTGCDYCNRWFHYECLPSDQQTLVDLSLVFQDNWACYQCSLVEE